MLTIETITTEQLRELTADRLISVRVRAKLALDEAVTHKNNFVVRDARAYCVRVLNERCGCIALGLKPFRRSGCGCTVCRSSDLETHPEIGDANNIADESVSKP